jgi:hypothetical protein
MKTDKQTFVFRLEWAQVLKQQPDSIRLAVYDSIIDYVQTGNEPPQDSAVYFAFLFIKNQIDKDAVKYEEVCAKRAAAGKKHKGNQHTNNRNKLEQAEQMEQMFQNGTNGTDNDNEYDNDIDNNTTINSSDIINAEKSAKKHTPTKKTFGQFKNVKLTDDEAIKLHNEFGDDAAGMVEYLSAYKAEKNYKTKSDYLTIKRWVVDAFYKHSNLNKNGNNRNDANYVSSERIVAAGFAMAEAGL